MTECLYQPNHIIHVVFPSESAETIKIPTAHHEFGANFIDPKLSDLSYWRDLFFKFNDKF